MGKHIVRLSVLVNGQVKNRRYVTSSNEKAMALAGGDKSAVRKLTESQAEQVNVLATQHRNRA